MTRQYTFDFSKMIVGDIFSLASGDPRRIEATMNRLLVGGFSHLPMSELPNVASEWQPTGRSYPAV